MVTRPRFYIPSYNMGTFSVTYSMHTVASFDRYASLLVLYGKVNSLIFTGKQKTSLFPTLEFSSRLTGVHIAYLYIMRRESHTQNAPIEGPQGGEVTCHIS